MTNATIAANLKTAADLIEAGFVKSNFEKQDPVTGQTCYCVVGAIRKVLKTDWFVDAELSKETKAFAKFLGCQNFEEFEASMFVENWNDNSSRTQEEVVAKLRECAESLTEPTPY